MQGYRQGYAAGRRTLDDYVFGLLVPPLLSPTGHFDHSCTHCHALLFVSETRQRGKQSGESSSSICCGNGRLKLLPLLPPAPAILSSFLSGFKAPDIPLEWHPYTSAGCISEHVLVGHQKARSVTFKQNIRSYNSALGFASFSDSLSPADAASGNQASIQNTSVRSGPPVYILHGRAYHIAGTLYPSRARKPKYAQLYVLDPAVST